MKLLTIERNPDTKQLEVVFSFNDNITVSIEIIEERLTVGMIKSTAESLGLNHELFVLQYEEMYRDLCRYSKYRTDMLRKHKILSAQYNDIFFTLVCGGVLSMSEIYWFDWYVKKNGLAKVND